VNAIVTLTDLDEVLLRAAREGARQALAETSEPSGWLSVKSAAEYLDMSADAITGAIKRGQLVPHLSATRRRRFTREQLDAFATARDIV